MAATERTGFWVVDLTGAGEVRLKQHYEYELLEQVEGAAELIGLFSANLWHSPEGFDVALPGRGLQLRWRACSDTCGLATLRDGDDLASVSILLTGQAADADIDTLNVVQRHIFRELHDTGHEAAFDLLHLGERPLLASINFRAPADPTDQWLFALADRCLAASYFRKMGLA